MWEQTDSNPSKKERTPCFDSNAEQLSELEKSSVSQDSVSLKENSIQPTYLDNVM